jgi:Uma2 family endonuclease
MARLRERGELPTTLEEFVVWHEKQPERWEFIDGEPVLMAPGSRRHTVIKGNIFRHLANKLQGTRCVAYVEGIELRAFEQSTIPDVVVSCSPPDFGTPVEAEPVVVVEVSSPSTFGRDMGFKLERYRLYPSLRHYLVVHPLKHAVILFHRESADMLTNVWQQTGTVDLPAIGVSLTMAEIFEGVPPPAPRARKHCA